MNKVSRPNLRKILLLSALLMVLSGCSANWGWYVVSPATQSGWNNLKFLLSGLYYTVALSVTAIVISIVIGLLVALPGLSSRRGLKSFNRIYVELVRADIHESGELFAMEDRPDETHVVHVAAVAVGVVADQNIPGLETLGPVFLDDVAASVLHGAEEDEQAAAHRGHGVAHLRRAGDADGEVVPVTDDGREGAHHEPGTHVIRGVTQSV